MYIFLINIADTFNGIIDCLRNFQSYLRLLKIFNYIKTTQTNLPKLSVVY